MILAPKDVSAQLVWTSGHGDIGIEFESEELEVETHWHLDGGAVVDGSPLPSEGEFEPEELILLVGTERNSPSNSASWLGVPGATQVWQTGSDANPPEVGFALHTVEVGDPGDWLDGEITISLTGWNSGNPGEVGIYSSFFETAIFSTFDSGATNDDNSFALGAGEHQHFAWYFTSPGYYELEFTWAGTYIGGDDPEPVAGSGTFGFQVIPEPSAWALLITGTAIVMLMRRRRTA